MAECRLCGYEIVEGKPCNPHNIPMRYEINGNLYPRVKFNEEGNCPSCGVPTGSEHHSICTIEPCARCGTPMQTCTCVYIGDKEEKHEE